MSDARGSVHHSKIHKVKSNKMQQCIKIFIIPYLYEAQHVSGDKPPIIKSLKLHWQPMVFLYVEGCWTCGWWSLSGTVLCLTSSTNHTWHQKFPGPYFIFHCNFDWVVQLATFQTFYLS
jgi:hypothetical protein